MNPREFPLARLGYHRKVACRAFFVVALAFAATSGPSLGTAVASSRGGEEAGASTAPRITGSQWVRLELVENSAEGPAFDRCEIEGFLVGRDPRRWRFLFGEASPGPGAGWQPLRSRSGCTEVASKGSPDPWTLRGVPYLLTDASLRRAVTRPNEDTLEASLTIRRLTGFTATGKPTYEERPITRVLRFPPEGSVVIPLLVSTQREVEAFGLRELLLRVHTAIVDSLPRVDYGEIEVVSDVPRAAILLDGGPVSRTSGEGSVVLSGVRTGPRELAVLDPSGRAARTIVKVEKSRRSRVELKLLPGSSPAGLGHLRPLGPIPQGSDEFWRDRDGAFVVRIPGGEFRMGSVEGEGESGEHPQHTVRVRGFLMDKTEVTWGQYRRFAAETGRSLPPAPVWGMPETLPVSNVRWEEALAFCAWAGGRLPTEAEWELAARGFESRRYPWGDDWDPARCNTQEGGPHAPTAAASYPGCASPYGVLDMAGNVWEWCQDLYDETYYARSPLENPAGPETGRARTTRGGSWLNPSSWVRGAMRQGIEPGWADPMHGFRCAQDDPAGARR